jgi:hypothetical protein
MYTPKNLKKWQSDSNYVGTEFTAYYIVACKADTDLTVLQESNFAVALEELGGASETVVCATFKHFCCGYFDLLLIHELDDVALQIADDIADRLANYPVLDDDDYSERELNRYDDEINSWAYDDACNILGISGDELKPENQGRIQRACMDCFQYYGEAYIREDKLWESLKESKAIVPFSWRDYEASKGQKFLDV